MNWERIATFIGIIVTLSGIYVAVDDRYAKADDLKQISKRLDIKIGEDRSNRIQERIWKLEDRYKTPDKAPQHDREEWRKLEQEKKSIDQSIQILIQTDIK